MRNHKLKRLYVDSPLVSGGVIILSDSQHHYLRNVMRLSSNANMLVFNGQDGEWKVELTHCDKKTSQALVLEQTRTQPYQPDIWLCYAPIKNSHSEYMIEKSTELGVSRFQPILTQHTIVNRIKPEKIRAHSIDAAQQCGRLSLPEIGPLLPSLDKALQDWPESRRILLCDETGQGTPIAQALSSYTAQHQDSSEPWAIFIGPEGGFSHSELALLYKLPYVTSVSMGPRVMRADTAAIAALTCWQSHLGDWYDLPEFRQDTR